ncbi:hypothetical protein GOBAR_AA12783 [Gossypium barbadense]|uniref:Uncharacterized protein n=1 Tax=Gossypium barbadense TaxID=3634 RepID=A0A2P5XWZ7_GOSBA|nr:hypothetical protein GOBAR_AA12783 [Gossypium barbadense]
MSETRFQNTETALKNQQALIQGLETQIGQLSKLISERPRGSLLSNTEPNPREQINKINTQDDEGVIELEPERRQETVVSKWRDEVGQNTNKPVTVKYKPRVSYPNATRKDHSDEQFGHIHEERRLRIEELDEWRVHKPRTHDKPKLCQNKADTSLNQLKVSGKVLLEAADPHIVTTTPNEKIPLTVLSIFPFSTVEVSHPKFGTFKENTGVGMVKHGRARGKARFCFFDMGVRHARANKPWTTIHGYGTLCHHREARRPRSKFGTHSLSFCKLRRRSYFRYYARNPSLQVAALTGLP